MYRANGDPRNGTLLNALFDRAFDRGLFTLDDDLRVIVSPKLRQATDPATLTCGLDQLAGRTIEVPSRFPPDGEAIRYHRASVFVR
jgi:predicted restriction endonuclease